jgi:hypothetical protein
MDYYHLHPSNSLSVCSTQHLIFWCEIPSKYNKTKLGLQPLLRVKGTVFGMGLPNVEGQLLQDYKTFFTVLPILLPLNSLNPSWDGSQWCNIKNLKNPKNTDVIELSVKSSSLCPLFGPAFTPYPLFQWYPQSKEILSNLSMKY